MPVRRTAGVAGGVEPDRVAQMGGRHGPEPTVYGRLARRLKAHAHAGRRPAGPAVRALPAAADGRLQRVVVKVRVSRHGAGGRGRAGLARHVVYLGRASASGDGRPGTFYAADRPTADARGEAVQWADDRHHFRIVVSPEREVPDLTRYVRDVMRAAERDLNVRLDWVAVNHFDTDNPHAHVLVRGRLPDGHDLVVPRRYLAHGLAARASEAATELLGPRTADEAHRVAGRDATAERFTWLDRAIVRRLEGGRIDTSPARWTGADPDERRAVVARLQFLSKAGLASRDGGTWWRTDPAFGSVLRDLDDRQRGGGRDAAARTAYAGVDVPGRSSSDVNGVQDARQHDDRNLPARRVDAGATGAPEPVMATTRRDLPVGGSVTGTYAGVERTPAGRRALVATDDGVFAVPVDRSPTLRIGTPVEASRSATATQIEPSPDRHAGRPTRDRGTDLEAGR